ncbi:MAG: four helix bundle protein [Clostridia bacterium]|nr:four helix bundle protein [Clostridia bacterium]
MAGIVNDKSCQFAVRIVNLCKFLRQEKHEYILSKQVMRSGTSIGANLTEGDYAISEKEFLAKQYIALKECVETLYWLQLLRQTDYLTDDQFRSLEADCLEIKRMLSASTKTMKQRQEQ